MKYVYRMENERGQGPYGHSPISVWAPNGHADSAHPDIIEDCLTQEYYEVAKHTGSKKDVLFACPTLKALHQWFSLRERRALRRLGFTVKVVPAKVVVLGLSGRQCIFVRGE